VNALLNVIALPTTEPKADRHAPTLLPNIVTVDVAFRLLIWPQCGRPPRATAAASTNDIHAALSGIPRNDATSIATACVFGKLCMLSVARDVADQRRETCRFIVPPTLAGAVRV
jgi:hypothetical protein